MNESSFPKEIRGYRPIGLCGQGAYGQVWLVQDFTGRWFALKIIYKRALGGDWQREYNGLVTYHQKVKRHPNLIEIYHIENRDTFFYYTMECADNFGDENEYIPSTLENWIHRFGKIGPESIKNIFDQLLDGVEALHEAGVIHRDIKPDNIIFVDHIPKLSDIGLMTSMTHSISLVGTQPYLPPEVLLGNSESKNSFGVDLYALGKSIYRAFSGNDPNDFPKVDGEILSEKKYRKLNKFVKTACHTNQRLRFKNTRLFRNALLKGISLKTIIFSFWSFLFGGIFKVFFFPFHLLRSLWRNDFVRNMVIIGVILLAVYHGKNWYDSYSIDYKASIGMLSSDERKEYDAILAQKNLSKKEKERKEWLESKVKKLKSASSIFNFKSAKDAELPRKYKLIYQEDFKDFKNWVFSKKQDIVLGKSSIMFGGKADCDMALESVKLPNDYQINFTLNGMNHNSIMFMVYSPESLGSYEQRQYLRRGYGSLDAFYPAAYEWEIMSTEYPEPLRVRRFHGSSYNFTSVSNPIVKVRMSRIDHKISIIKKGSFLRIFCDNQLLYEPVDHIFNGGRFRMIISMGFMGELKIKDLKIYDISPKNFIEKLTGNSFPEPDVTTKRKNVEEPQSPNTPLSRSEAFIMNKENWHTIPENSGVIKYGKFIPNRECLLVFKQKLPKNFKIDFEWERLQQKSYFEMRFIDKFGPNSTLNYLLQNAHSTIFRFYDTEKLDIFDTYFKYGLKRMLSESSFYKSFLSIVKKDAYVKINNKYSMFMGGGKPKYLAFYFPPGCKNNLLYVRLNNIRAVCPGFTTSFLISVSEIVNGFGDNEFSSGSPLAYLLEKVHRKEQMSSSRQYNMNDNDSIIISRFVQKKYIDYLKKQPHVDIADIKSFIASKVDNDSHSYRISDNYIYKKAFEVIDKYNVTLPQAESLIKQYIAGIKK